MCGIVTLLGNPFKSEMESLWGMIDDACGSLLDDGSRFVHFSYHVAEGYDLDLLLPILQEIARAMRPFKVQTKGLGLFSGEKPVLYIKLLKNVRLFQFQEFVWKQVSLASRGNIPYYAPKYWVPHITLAKPRNQKSLSCLMERIVNQAFNWELVVDNIAYVSAGDGQNNCDIRQYQLVGDTAEIYPHLPLSAGSRSALVIVDMQEFFLTRPERKAGLDEVIQNINQLIDYFDSNELPVIHVVSSYRADGADWDLKMKSSGTPELLEGEHESQILQKIMVSESHKRISKTRYSAFFKTDLAMFLNAKNIQRVVVVGAYTHYCVNATIFDAYAHDFIPCLITDAVISHLEFESDMMISRMKRNGYHTFKTSEFLKESA